MHNIENKLGLNNIFLMPFKGRRTWLQGDVKPESGVRGAMQRQRSIQRKRKKVKRGMFHIFFYAKREATFPLGRLYIMPFGIFHGNCHLSLHVHHAILKIQ